MTVGWALARNPFRIMIPCRRAVRSNGEPGGYHGSLSTKGTLLEMEGVENSPAGKVSTARLDY
jgi:methylated-DNA-[protein]-cysteine S-methyltransferase